jgi:hypothetical protein
MTEAEEAWSTFDEDSVRNFDHNEKTENPSLIVHCFSSLPY